MLGPTPSHREPHRGLGLALDFLPRLAVGALPRQYERSIAFLAANSPPNWAAPPPRFEGMLTAAKWPSSPQEHWPPAALPPRRGLARKQWVRQDWAAQACPPWAVRPSASHWAKPGGHQARSTAKREPRLGWTRFARSSWCRAARVRGHGYAVPAARQGCSLAPNWPMRPDSPPRRGRGVARAEAGPRSGCPRAGRQGRGRRHPRLQPEPPPRLLEKRRAGLWQAVAGSCSPLRNQDFSNRSTMASISRAASELGERIRMGVWLRMASRTLRSRRITPASGGEIFRKPSQALSRVL